MPLLYSWCSPTLIAPAECPTIVTLLLSPPNCSMLAWTHLSARSWSLRPTLRSSSEGARVGMCGAVGGAAGSGGDEVKPNVPRR